MVSPTMDKPPVTNLKPICAALALAADDGVMTYLKMMLC
jgi:hypothetical protein